MPAGYVLLRSLSKSQEKPVKASIKGKMPEWLKGSLFRNGPGRYEFGEKSYKHLFDGQACVHKFKINDEQVEYSNKLLQTKSYLKTLSDNRLYPMFGTSDVKSNLFKRLSDFFKSSETKDNVNVSVAPFANSQLYALTETNLMCRLDPNDLSIMKTVNIKEHLPGVIKSIAHPHILSDGSWITMGVNVKHKPAHYDFIKFDSSVSKIEHIGQSSKTIASIESSFKDGMSYLHHFGITENYIVFLEMSLLINFKTMLLNVIKNKPFSDSLLIDPEWKTRIRVVNRHTGVEVAQKFFTEPMMVFHHINAFEKVDPQNSDKLEICLDACVYDPRTFDINAFQYEYMLTEKLLGAETMNAKAKRVVIPVDLKKSGEEIFCESRLINGEHSVELPTINYERFNGLPYKYFYSVSHYNKPFTVFKMNVEDAGDVRKMAYEEAGVNFLPMEPVFVESPNATSEDDGVLLVMVLSDKNDFLSVLDARDLKEIARAEVPEDTKGAFNFHGFFADAKKQKPLNV